MPTTSPRRARRPAQAVTSARRSVEQDRSRRMRQYLIAMGIRTVAFPVAVWAFMTERYVIAWVAAFLAVVIPSFAVMIANAVDQRQGPRTERPQSPTRQLGPAAVRPAEDQPSEPGEVLRGEVVSGSAATPGRSTSPDEPAGAPRS